MKFLLLGLTTAALLRAAYCFMRWRKSWYAKNRLEDFYAWRECQQSKWRIKYPSTQFDQTPKWDDDIPVFASKEKK